MRNLLHGSSVVIAVLAGVVSFNVCVSAREAPFKPAVPLLEIKLESGETNVYRTGQQDPMKGQTLKRELERLAAHNDPGNGWDGVQVNGVSENPLVMHAAAMVDYKQVESVLAAAALAKVYRIVVGVPEYTTDKLSGEKAPDMEKLDAGYLHFNLPKDEGLESEPPTPKEFIAVQAIWDAKAKQGSYIVAIDERGRKPVEDSGISAADLQATDAKSRDAVRSKLKDAIAGYIKKAGKVDYVQLAVKTEGEEVKAAPWALIDQMYRAAQKVNAEREKNEQQKLEIMLPFQTPVAEPPPPERLGGSGKDDPDKKEDNAGKPDKPDDFPDLAENPDGADPQPKNASKPTEAYAFRRDSEVERPNEDRVKAALNWLKDHQNREGYWSATAFNDDSTRLEAKKTYNLEFIQPGNAAGDKGWEASCDIGLTGLALLAFTGNGYDHKSGDYRATIRQAILSRVPKDGSVTSVGIHLTGECVNKTKPPADLSVEWLIVFLEYDALRLLNESGKLPDKPLRPEFENLPR